MSDPEEEILSLNELKAYYRRLVENYQELLIQVGSLQLLLREKGVVSLEEWHATVAKVTALGRDAAAAETSLYESRRALLRNHDGEPQ